MYKPAILFRHYCANLLVISRNCLNKTRFSLIIPLPVVGTAKYRENFTLPPMPGISEWRAARGGSPLVISHDFVPGGQNHSSRMGLVQSSSQSSFPKKVLGKLASGVVYSNPSGGLARSFAYAARAFGSRCVSSNLHQKRCGLCLAIS